MRVCVVGAGAIGGLLAVKLASAGNDVSVLARGKHLEAIRSKGLTLNMAEETLVADNIRASSDLKELGEQDVVFLAVKAHQVEAVADDLRHTGDQSAIVTLQNGIPWWYFQHFEGELAGSVIRTVDPKGDLVKKIDSARLIGCVVYPAASIEGPGVIRHEEGVRFPIGELDGSQSQRVERISKMLVEAGFKSPVLPDIRSELWLKLWGSVCFNPVSALTQSTLKELCTYPFTRQLAIDVMTEVQVVAETVGASFRVPLERRLDGAANVGDHKTSTLQDVENGRAMEIDAIVGTAVELGKLTETPTPHLDTLHALIKLLNEKVMSGYAIRASKVA